jgi:transposase-like protein
MFRGSDMATERYRRDLKGMEARRRRGMRMLQRGVAQADIARTLGVGRQAVSAWWS